MSAPTYNNKYIDALRNRRFVSGERRSGKTSALILYAMELRSSGQEPVIVVPHNEHQSQILSLYSDLVEQYGLDNGHTSGKRYRCPIKIVCASKGLNALRGYSGPRLVDEFFFCQGIHSLPLADGILFHAGVSSFAPKGMDEVIW